MIRPPLLILLTTAALACDGGPSDSQPSPPDPGVYTGIVTIDSRANAGDVHLTVYTSTAPTCADKLWVEVEGLCDLRFSPDNAGFADLPSWGDTDLEGGYCDHGGAAWRYYDGVIHYTVVDGLPTLRISAAEACTVQFAPGSSTPFACESDVSVRLDLRLSEGGSTGIRDCPALAAGALEDGSCGPALTLLPCEG